MRLRAEVVPAGEQRGTVRIAALPEDVRPGRPVRARLALRAPGHPGSYRLRLSLVQVKDGPLERYGAAELEIPVAVELAPLRGEFTWHPPAR